MTEMLVFDETLQKRKISHLTKSIKYLSPIQSIVYALRQWGHVSQSEIANSLYCSQAYVAGVEKKTRMILPGEQFPESFTREELIMPSNISNGGLVLLKKLTSIQAFIGALRLGLLENQREIAKILDCSQPYVQMLERKSKVILGQCEIVEIWNQVKVDRKPWSPEARRVAKEGWTLERRQEASEKIKQFYQTSQGKAQKEKQREFSKELVRKWREEPRHINKAEQQLQDFLTQWGFLYKYVGDGIHWIGICFKSKCNHFPYVKAGRNPDFVHRFLPGIIEMYGDFFHKKEKLENGGDDGQNRIDHYAIFGYNTLIIWEHELKDALKDSRKALDLYNRLYEFELELRGEFRSEFGVDFPALCNTFSNPA